MRPGRSRAEGAERSARPGLKLDDIALGIGRVAPGDLPPVGGQKGDDLADPPTTRSEDDVDGCPDVRDLEGKGAAAGSVDGGVRVRENLVVLASRVTELWRARRALGAHRQQRASSVVDRQGRQPSSDRSSSSTMGGVSIGMTQSEAFRVFTIGAKDGVHCF